MIDLTKSITPHAVKVGGVFFRIHTDFKYFLLFQKKLADKKTKLGELDFMYIDPPPKDRVAGLNAILEFMQPREELPRHLGDESSEKLLDYELDADYIFAAFYEQYKINLVTTKLHWYQFNALLRGLHDTELNKIISARVWKNEDGKNTPYNKYMQRQHDAWRLPQPEDNEPDEELDAFLSELKK